MHKYKVLITATYIGYTTEGRYDFLQKEKINDSIFIEQQKKYHELVNKFNASIA